MAASTALCASPSSLNGAAKRFFFSFPSSSSSPPRNPVVPLLAIGRNCSLLSLKLRHLSVLACLSSSSAGPAPPPSSGTGKKLYVSGLSFRTTEASLRKAFENFGDLIEVNLVMDKIANRPRGFAFLRYATEEESQRAIEGMHGKFLDGRVIFVEVARPRSELRQNQS
ncbi:hypothetical protein SAY87_003627 [Trapa incisa]|uniref:RRM domain-containing protein n=1 Tax=Trapa incisa TaxID=236973 RepID=A0AAN7KRK0_9MYRT|nr:hypothetical protein SAY87_003627 [Trapa incisa]